MVRPLVYTTQVNTAFRAFWLANLLFKIRQVSLWNIKKYIGCWGFLFQDNKNQVTNKDAAEYILCIRVKDIFNSTRSNRRLG